MNIEIPLSLYMHSEIHIYVPVPHEFTESGKPQEKFGGGSISAVKEKNEKLNT